MRHLSFISILLVGALSFAGLAHARSHSSPATFCFVYTQYKQATPQNVSMDFSASEAFCKKYNKVSSTHPDYDRIVHSEEYAIAHQSGVAELVAAEAFLPKGESFHASFMLAPVDTENDELPAYYVVAQALQDMTPEVKADPLVAQLTKTIHVHLAKLKGKLTPDAFENPANPLHFGALHPLGSDTYALKKYISERAKENPAFEKDADMLDFIYKVGKLSGIKSIC